MNHLETTKLVKRYGGRTVVNEVSFVLAQREVVGILGRNGAGKTTTFRMIIGMIRPESGVVTFDGFDVTNLPMYKRARRGMGYLSQEHSIFRQLTVWQNLIAILETLNIKDGLKLAEGKPKDIINDPRVKDAYLGRTFKGDEFDGEEFN